MLAAIRFTRDFQILFEQLTWNEVKMAETIW
jgi:hypothetical protein